MGSLWQVQATHIRAGEITAERINCQSREYVITITAYTDTNSGQPDRVLFGEGYLDFGDGSKPLLVKTDQVSRQIIGDGIELNIFKITKPFPSSGVFVISYREKNRNQEILNISNPVNTPFYLETRITIDNFFGCNDSPKLEVRPIDRGCNGVAFFHNAGAYDIDGDSLSYDFVVPKSDKGVSVVNYRDPNLPEFYVGMGIPYNQANEAGDGPPTFEINHLTGDITWDSPGAPGEYNIAFKVIEWRKIGGKWYQIGYVTRDMQIIISDCLNDRPELIVPKDTCVVAGTLLKAKVFAMDRPTTVPPSGVKRYDDVKIEAFSQLFSIAPFPANVSPDPAVFQNTVPPSRAELDFSWQTDCQHIREQPYLVSFKATDNPPNGPGLVVFKPWSIKVVPPAPNLIRAERVLPGRSVKLDFDNYSSAQCGNASTIEVWRRVDSYEFEPDTCDTGMPSFAGYELISEIPANSSGYIDDNGGKGLDYGAVYCYRLVAKFPLPQGGESIVSVEQCTEPIKAEAPIITNVTIEKTDEAKGEIEVVWRAPFDIDEKAFTAPYEYRIFRAEGLEGSSGSVQVGSFTRGVMDKNEVFTFRDTTGLDTKNQAYNYKITFLSNGSEVETSSTASSVRLELKTSLREIKLNWEARVPWSINTQDFPEHEVFAFEWDAASQPEPTLWTDTRFSLLGKSNVNTEGFTYLDDTALDETKEYCYFVVTKGSYGNDSIGGPLDPNNPSAPAKVPLINRSQISCAFPSDSIAPCGPGLALDLIQCRAIGDLGVGGEYFFDDKPCDFGDFQNTLKWAIPNLECGDDISSYEIFYSPTSKEEDFTFLINIKAEGNPLDSMTFIHKVDQKGLPLTSFKGCYKVRALDRSNNKSAFSNTVCKDNCPNYVLPNVFTPDVTLGFNDTFMAYNDAFGSGGEGQSVDGFDLLKCPRFVESVKFNVFNRWGKEVYTYRATAGDENSLLIDWDGRSNSGEELSSGVYYYVAEVTFDVLDPNNKTRQMKGWIKIIR